MQKSKILLSFLSLLLSSTLLAGATGLSRAERALAIGELAGSRARLLALVSGLSDDQLSFRPNHGGWTIAECLEHLTLTEESFGGWVAEMVGTPPDAELPRQLAKTDEEILAEVRDRTDKFQAPTPFHPTGRWSSAEEMLEVLAEHREQRIRFVAETDKHLRHHGTEFPFGRADAFQALLTLATHCHRHAQQIEEIMADPGFPD